MFRRVARGAGHVVRFWLYPFKLAAKPAIEGGKALHDLAQAAAGRRTASRRDTYASALARRKPEAEPLAELSLQLHRAQRLAAGACVLAAGAGLVHLALLNVLALLLAAGSAFMFWALALRYCVRRFQVERFLQHKDQRQPLASFSEFKHSAPLWWVLRPLDLDR